MFGEQMEDAREDCVDKEHYEYLLRRCDSFAKERGTLLSSLLSVSERFDNWIIGLPAGATGLTLVFYEKVVATSLGYKFGALAVSWTFLGIAIGLGFLSLYLSMQAVQRQIEIQDEEHQDFLKHSTPSKPEGIKRRKVLSNRWSKWTHYANLASVLASIVGISAFLSFAYQISHARRIIPASSNEQQQGQPTEESGGLRTAQKLDSPSATEEASQGRLHSSKVSAAPTAEEVTSDKEGTTNKKKDGPK